MDERIDRWMETITNTLFYSIIFFCIPYFMYVIWKYL
jgi:hypothetical protein